MKKTLLLSFLGSGFACLMLCGNAAGPSFVNHFDCTGGESAGVGAYVNPTGCSAAGSSCHGTAGSNTSTITVAIELDSAGGVPTKHYKAGLTYTVKITGTNMSGLSRPLYGFQLAALQDSVSTSSNADAGTWTTTGLPTGTHFTAPSTLGTQLSILEHSSPQTPSLLGGTQFTQTFTWTAPASGTGTISFWGAANFVNGDALASAADIWNTDSVWIHEWPHPASVAIVATQPVFGLYPNPAGNSINIRFGTGWNDNCSVRLLDMTGNCVASANVANVIAQKLLNIPVTNLAAGLYQCVVTDGTSQCTTPFIKGAN